MEMLLGRGLEFGSLCGVKCLIQAQFTQDESRFACIFFDLACALCEHPNYEQQVLSFARCSASCVNGT